MVSRRILPVLVWLILFSCVTPDSAWEKVKDQLQSISERNQRYRLQMDSVARMKGWQSEDVAKLYSQQKALDSVNLAEINEIITRYGYPSRVHVGDLAAVPFEVIRHSDEAVMIDYLELIAGAGKNGDIPMEDVAAFEDRVWVSQKQPQKYGTQIWIEFVHHPKTGEEYDSVYLWPVRDPARVESRRASAGLDSLTDQLRHYGIDPAKGYLLRKAGTASN